MRRVFLWAARNSWLKAHLPGLWFMQRAVRRFMPGETMDDALKAAVPLQTAGIATLYTRLGENLESLAEADAVVAHYLELTDRIVAAGIHGEISVKPTQLGLDHDPAACLANVIRLAEHAAAAGSFLWIDMEGSAYTDATIELYEQAQGGPAEDRHLPAGLPQAHGRRYPAAAPARPGDPPRQGRLRRAGGDRLSRPARASTPTTSGSRSGSCSTGAASPSASGSARTTSR